MIRHIKKFVFVLLLSGLFIPSLVFAQGSSSNVPIQSDELEDLVEKEFNLDTALKLAGSIMERNLSNYLKSFIQNPTALGSGGSFPVSNASFVTDPRGLLSTVEREAGIILQDQFQISTAQNVCAPFANTVNQALADAATQQDERRQNTQNEVDRATECTLDNALGVVTGGGNPATLQQYTSPGGFSQYGGYGPLLQAFTRPQNDPNELKEIAKAVQARRMRQAAQEIGEEVDRGQGYLAQKNCVTPGPSGTCLKYETITPGINLAETTQENISQSLEELANIDELSELVIAAIQTFTRNVLSNRGLLGS